MFYFHCNSWRLYSLCSLCVCVIMFTWNKLVELQLPTYFFSESRPSIFKLPAVFVVKKRSVVNGTTLTWKFMTLVIFYFYYLSSLRAMSKMDPHSFNYSMKNVPVPSNENYELEFLNIIHTFSSRCQWRAAHF